MLLFNTCPMAPLMVLHMNMNQGFAPFAIEMDTRLNFVIKHGHPSFNKQPFFDNASCEFMCLLQLLVTLMDLQLVPILVYLKRNLINLYPYYNKKNYFFQGSTSTSHVLNHVSVSLVSSFSVDINTKHRQ